jgi:hypothetical protein
MLPPSSVPISRVYEKPMVAKFCAETTKEREEDTLRLPSSPGVHRQHGHYEDDQKRKGYALGDIWRRE